MSSIKTITMVLGLFYLLIGVLGFIPAVTTPGAASGQGLLFGIFAVNTVHNVAHLVAGAILFFGSRGAGVAGVNKLMAVVFALLTIGSFVAPVVEALSLNTADTVLHLVSFLITGYLGFIAGPSAAPA